MKKIVALLLLAALPVLAYDYTYSTNLFNADPNIDLIYIGTNGTDPGGYDAHHWACVINHNSTWLNGQVASSYQLLTNYISTNVPSGGTNAVSGITNFVLTASNLPPGSAATATVTSISNNTVSATIGIPTGSNGVAGASGTNAYYYTNTTAYYNLSNAIVSSVSYSALSTNFNYSSSNYWGKFTNVVSFSAVGPQYTIAGSGLSPGGVGFVPVNVYWSTTGTNGWSTNLPAAPNIVYAATTCISNGLGSFNITVATHPEAYGHTNDLRQQLTWVAGPVGVDDATTKSYVDNLVATKMANNWSSDGTNYSYGGVHIAVPVNYYNAISTPVLDGTGTNYQITIATTNFIAGWQFQVSTNLLNPFYTPAQYTITTNSGVATFTTPISQLSAALGFFRIVSPQPGKVKIDYPLILATNAPITPISGAGYFWPSNYNLYWVTPTKTNLIVVGQ
jgi:hypothetical protein